MSSSHLPVRYIKNENNDMCSSLLSLIKKGGGKFLYWVTGKQLLKASEHCLASILNE